MGFNALIEIEQETDTAVPTFSIGIKYMKFISKGRLSVIMLLLFCTNNHNTQTFLKMALGDSYL